MSKKILFSGMQPSGKMHLGNYIGAIMNYSNASSSYSSGDDRLFMIADLHSLNVLPKRDKLTQDVKELATMLYALDEMSDVKVFRQSAISEHSELSVLLSTIIPFGMLSRMTQFKDKSLDSISYKMTSLTFEGIYTAIGCNFKDMIVRLESKNGDIEDYDVSKLITEPELIKFADSLNDLNQSDFNDFSSKYLKKILNQKKSISSGLFTYPILQAADILLYGSSAVPVGEDQKQHLELSRYAAKRFNKHYGENIFYQPKPVIPESGGRVMSLSNPMKKMSKTDESIYSCIYLNDSNDDIIKKIKKSVTDSEPLITFDSERRGIYNMISISAKLQGKSLEDAFAPLEGLKTSKFKDAVAEVIIEKISPIREKYNLLMKEGSEEVDGWLDNNNSYARKIASSNMKKVREIVGI